MSKTSRIILWCVLIAVLAMCIALYIAAKRPIEDTAYRNAGKTYAESQQPGDETPVITGGDFTIMAHTFENMCTQNRASGMTEDAYWASMFETRKLMLTLESYTQAQEAAFLAAGHTRDEADAWHDFAMRSQKQPWTRRTSRSPRRTLGRSRATITTPPVHGRSWRRAPARPDKAIPRIFGCGETFM